MNMLAPTSAVTPPPVLDSLGNAESGCRMGKKTNNASITHSMDPMRYQSVAETKSAPGPGSPRLKMTATS